jgi:hypothetical protein
MCLQYVAKPAQQLHSRLTFLPLAPSHTSLSVFEVLRGLMSVLVTRAPQAPHADALKRPETKVGIRKAILLDTTVRRFRIEGLSGPKWNEA